MCSFNCHLWHKPIATVGLRGLKVFSLSNLLWLSSITTKNWHTKKLNWRIVLHIIYGSEGHKNIIVLTWLTSLQRPQLLLREPWEFRASPTVFKKKLEVYLLSMSSAIVFFWKITTLSQLSSSSHGTEILQLICLAASVCCTSLNWTMNLGTV